MKHTIVSLQPVMALLCAFLLTACTDRDEMPAGHRVPLTLNATIEGAASGEAAATRAAKYTTHDLWSNWGFEVGDALGFFSKTGGGADGNQAMVNIKLTAESVSSTETVRGAKFRAENGTNIETGNLTKDNVLFYFPYDEQITGTGLKLRVEDDSKDGIMRCTDFLADGAVNPESLDKGDLSGIIRHAFGELIILRGKGFETPGINAGDYKDNKAFYEKITVVMRNPVTHVKINYKANPWECKTALVYDASSSEDCDNRDARRWQAWKGDLYGQTVGQDGQDAWYVIVPTLRGAPSIVEYIEIFDNDGKLQKVSVLRLDDKDDSNTDRDHQDRDGNYVWAGWRYPLKIAMKELVPTVNPYPILPWEQTDNDITTQRAPGIANPTDFRDWLTQYETYLKNDRSPSYEDNLKPYGDLEVTGDQRVWHFYISTDIIFEKTGNPTIGILQDILDGHSSKLAGHVFSNNTLTNVSRTFVDKLKGNGSLRNIDFKSPTVTVPEGKTPAGIIANEIEGGTVTNCNINSGGLIGNSGTVVGILAGSIKGGTVENCTLSGLIIGTKSDAQDGYMFGSKSGNPTLTNNNSTNVTFSDINQTDN